MRRFGLLLLIAFGLAPTGRALAADAGADPVVVDGGASDVAPVLAPAVAAPTSSDAADGGVSDAAGPSPSAPGATAAVETTVAAEPVATEAAGAEATVAASAQAPADDWLRRWVIGDWTSKGELGMESRAFASDDSDATTDQALGLLGRLELRHTHEVFDEKVRVYGRLDRFDEQRSVLVWEEAFLQVASERVRLRAGLDLVNWTATEAFHPADVINARNLDSDLENLEKLGEPMLALQVSPWESTTLIVLALPYRSEPIFASPRSRLNFVPGLDLRDRRRMLDREGDFTDDNWGPQGAIALRQVLGQADLTIHALEHMDRAQPLARVDLTTLQPYLLFQTVRQLGGTYQQALGSLLIKLEGAYRDFVRPRAALPGIPAPGSPFVDGMPDHGQLALGFEYGVPHPTGPESTFLLEGQTMLGDFNEVERAALSVFQRDVLLGYRLALNDESGQELLLGAIFDLDRAGETLFNVSYQQRLGDTWTLKAGVRIFHAEPGAPSLLTALRKSDHVRLTLTRHF